jgi:trk system potassium uptake protein TrkA
MNIVIVGGGKIGYYLTRTLMPYKHRISLIEQESSKCERIANELDIAVLNGDGTDVEALRSADTDDADAVIAVTGKDEDNLVICQLAKSAFNVPTTIARVNNPKNIEVFTILGVDITISSTSMIAEVIEEKLDHTGIKSLIKLRDGEFVISEIEIMRDCPIKDKSLREIKLPNKFTIIAVVREGQVLIPNGDTQIKENDLIIAGSQKKDQHELKEIFVEKKHLKG